MKSVLLGSSALVALGLLTGIGTGTANAACAPMAPTTGQFVTCSGTTSSGAAFVTSTDTDITVTLDSTAALTETGANAIVLGPAVGTGNETIHLLDGAYIKTTINNSNGISINGAHDVIDLNGTGKIEAHGISSRGIYGTGAYTAVTLNDDALVKAYDSHGDGIYLRSDHDTVTLNDNSKVKQAGVLTVGNAILLKGDNNTIVLNDNAGVYTNNSGNQGAEIYGLHGAITLNGHSHIVTYSGYCDGAYIRLGDFGAITLNGGAFIHAYGGGGSRGANILGDHATIALNGGSAIVTTGNNAFGAYIRGDSSSILVSDSSIATTGDHGRGAFVDGDSSSILVNDSSINTTGNYASGAYVNGASGIITLNGAHITTAGNYGNGAYIYGASSTITLNNTVISTGGDLAHGVAIYAGAGNTGTVTINGLSTIDLTGADAHGIHVSATSGHVTLNDTASIHTSGAAAHGIDVTGNTNTITLNNAASINNSGAGSYGIQANGNGNLVQIGRLASVMATGVGSAGISLSNGNNTIVNSGTISVNGVGILGDNNAANSDTIFNSGTIIGSGGTAIDLGDGNDTLTLNTGSQITGTIDGGAGIDTAILKGSGSEDDVFNNFEHLIVQSSGTDWSLLGTSTFQDIDIQQGKLHVNGNLTATAGMTVEAAGTLAGNGMLTGDVTSFGTIAPGNSVGTLTIAGNFTQTGGAFEVQVDRSGFDRLNVLGPAGATLLASPVLKVSAADGSTGGTGIILHADHGITGSFGAIQFHGNGAATLLQTAADAILTIRVIAVDGTPVAASAFAASEAGLDFLDNTGDEQIAGIVHCGFGQHDCWDENRKHVWMKGFGQFGNESANGGDRGFSYRVAGTSMGGDMRVAKDLRLGVSGGYSNTDETQNENAASADINTGQLGLYADWQHGPFFVTGLISGGWQGFDLSRNTSTGDADATTHGWLFGTAVQAGVELPFPHGWRLTPSAGIAYQHQWVMGYDEHGADSSDISIKDHGADALRLKAQLELANDIPWQDMMVTPHLTIGVQQQENFGGTATGVFTTGDVFPLALKDERRTVGLIGLGVEASFQNGLSTYVDYDGKLTTDRTVHAVTGGLRYSW